VFLLVNSVFAKEKRSLDSSGWIAEGRDKAEAITATKIVEAFAIDEPLANGALKSILYDQFS